MNRHRKDIQGLRALAVLLVALGHAHVGFLRGGFVGVDVFFVLSGFLITGLLLAEDAKNGSISLLDFYVRRARRILPAAALTLLVTDVASLYALNFVRAGAAVGDSVHAAAFSANFRFAARGVDYFAQGDPPSPFLHFWSLSVEEQFYFVWPLLLVLALRTRRPLAVVAATLTASFVWSLHETSVAPTAAYFSPLTRGWELALGAALAVAATCLARTPVRVRAALGWLGVALIGAAAVGCSSGTPFPGAAALLPTVGAGLAIVAGMGEASPRSVSRVLALRPLGVVGDRSYAYYLWHWPLLVLAAAYAGHELSVEVNLMLLVVAFVVSCLSYALVENPIRTRMRSRRSTVAVAAVCTVGVLGTAATSFATIDREAQRFGGGPAAAVSPVSFRTRTIGGPLPAVVAAVRSAERGDPLPQDLTPPIGQLRNFGAPYMPPKGCVLRQRETGTTSRVCRVGDVRGRRLVVLLGDSHALMWLPSLLETASHDHFAVVPLIRLGCTPGRWTSDDKTGCRDWFRWASVQAMRLHPQATLVAGSVGGDRGLAAARPALNGMLAAARTLKAHGRVVVIGDPEGLADDPVDCLLRSGATMATCTTTWAAASLAVYDKLQREAARLGAAFLATRGLVCFDHRCPAVVGHTIVRMDTNHLTVAYAAQVAPAFRSLLLPLIAGAP